MINWGRLEELKADIGAEDFEEVVQLFLAEVEEVLEGLAGLHGDDLAAAMHMLKGSALNLGFDRFGALCSDAESAARNGQEAKIDLPAIAASYRAAKEALMCGQVAA